MLDNFQPAGTTFTKVPSSQPALNMILSIENHVGQFPRMSWQPSLGLFLYSLRSTWFGLSKIMLAGFPYFLAKFQNRVLFFRTCAQHDPVHLKSCWAVFQTSLQWQLSSRALFSHSQQERFGPSENRAISVFFFNIEHFPLDLQK